MPLDFSMRQANPHYAAMSHKPGKTDDGFLPCAYHVSALRFGHSLIILKSCLLIQHDSSHEAIMLSFAFRSLQDLAPDTSRILGLSAVTCGVTGV
jgi:hypothetical protein